MPNTLEFLTSHDMFSAPALAPVSYHVPVPGPNPRPACACVCACACAPSFAPVFAPACASSCGPGFACAPASVVLLHLLLFLLLIPYD